MKIDRQCVVSEPKSTASEYFSEQCALFSELADRATLISYKIGRRMANQRAVMASWIFMRTCITAKSIELLFKPIPSGYGNASYLDHASIAALCRCLIESVTVLLYLGDDTVSEDEWECRRCLIDLHDFRSREEFLSLIGAPAPKENPADTHKMLQDRLENNPFFKTPRLVGGIQQSS